MPDPARMVLLYDGICGLCNRLVRFVLKRDARAHFRFASLQSPYAGRILRRHGLDPTDLDTLYLIEEPDGLVANRSDAVIFILRKLGGFWTVIALAMRTLPRPLRDWGYSVAACRRYRVFGKYEACPLPEPKYRERFLDL